MPVGITDEHRELAATVRSFVERHDALKSARAALDGGDALPAFWPDMAALGWLGLHVAEEHGGSGYGPLELAIVAEELGRACTPGPFLPTAVVAGVIDRAGSPALRDELLGGLVAGELIAGLALVEGGPVLCGAMADVVAVPSGDDLVLVGPQAWRERANLDLTRPCVTATIDASTIAGDRRVAGGASIARALFTTVAGAEAAGGIAACTEMAADYARERIAFGRPIGQFQAVKHHCADMRIEEELAVALAWQAARAGDHAVLGCAARSVPAFLRVAQTSIQVLGGIGFTWEHDAHLYLRRAAALCAFIGDGDEARLALGTAATEIAGERARFDLPDEAERVRAEIRSLREQHDALAPDRRHHFLADNGLLFPSWPTPYGRGAGAVEQLVIDEELAGVSRAAGLGPNAWTLPIVLPTVLVHGTDDQRERWSGPTLRGELRWCQLFSEPGAGSDLAALATRAVRVDGGWLVTGQKVWTSHAQHAAVGLALVRTDPAAPKHRGITCMVVDMSSPGVTIRPLRQITGSEEFNEVFLDEVFVPDDDVIGDVNGGWSVARTTLGNERVSLGGEVAGLAPIVSAIHAMATGHGAPALAALGDAVAAVIAIRAVNLRATACAVDGVEPSPGGNVTKLVAAELVQRLGDLAHRLTGGEGVFVDGAGTLPSMTLLQSRMATIAGGTSEIVRNVIGERLLGLPRDSDERGNQR